MSSGKGSGPLGPPTAMNKALCLQPGLARRPTPADLQVAPTHPYQPPAMPGWTPDGAMVRSHALCGKHKTNMAELGHSEKETETQTPRRCKQWPLALLRKEARAPGMACMLD